MKTYHPTVFSPMKAIHLLPCFLLIFMVISSYAQDEQSLIAHWSFDSTSDITTFFDVTGNGYHATCSKQLNVQPGIMGNALESVESDYFFYIDGSLAGFNVPHFTISALVYTYVEPNSNSATHNDQIILSHQSYPNGAASGYEIEINGDGSIHFIMAVPNDGWVDCAGTRVLPKLEWHHVVGTYNGDSIKIYIDGILDKSLYQPNGYTASNYNANIGCQADNPEGTSRNWFNGRMDELLFYNYALDAQAITELYTSYDLSSDPPDPPEPPTPALIAHWSFDSSSTNTTFYDITGNGYDATCTKELSTLPGIKGNALESMVSDYTFYIDNSLDDFTLSNFTIASWVYTIVEPGSNTSQHNDQIILSYQSYPNTARGYELEINGDGAIRFIMGTGSNWLHFGGKTVLLPRQWYHVAGTYDGDSMKIYINGELDSSLYQPNGYAATTQNAIIGCQSGVAEDTARNWFKGQMDELLLYNYALDAQAITDLYTSYDVSPDTPSVIAHWSFDSTNGDDSYYDMTGNGYTAITNELSIAEGISGEALHCDDSTFQIKVENSIGNMNIDHFTIEGWIYSDINLVDPGSFYNYKVIFNNTRTGLEGSGVTGGYALQITDKGQLQTAMSNPTQGTWITCISDDIILPRQWYHVASTYDGASLKLYINGILSNQITATNGYFQQSTITASIGCQFQVTDPATNTTRLRTRFNGKIDELKLYNFALDAEALKSVYDALKPEDEPPFEINIGMKTTYAQGGDTVVMPVYIANHESYSINAVQLTLNYPEEKLELLSITKDSGIVKSWELFEWNDANPGSILLAMAGSNLDIDYGEGELFRCIFIVAPNVSTDDTLTITLDDVNIDENNNIIVSTLQNGRIIIDDQSILYGDVNGNNEVNIFDAQNVLKFVVGAITVPADCCPNLTVAVADVSGNGTISSYDASLIFQYSIGLIPEFPVESAVRKSLSKRAITADKKAELSFTTVSSSEDAIVIDLVGSNLCDFHAGEFAIECNTSSESIAQSEVTTAVHGGTLFSRFSADDMLLKVAVSTNDDIDHDEPVTLIRITMPPSADQSTPDFSIKTALLNEGTIPTDFAAEGLTGIKSRSIVSEKIKPAIFPYKNKLTVRQSNAEQSILVIWDLQGRQVLRKTIATHSCTIEMSRLRKGTYLYRLQNKQSQFIGRFMLIQ